MPSSGQASAEYAAMLALAAAVLAGAGAVVGLEDVGRAVAGGVRTGICIVGGDVCRASDAAAAGLAPCTMDERSEGGGATVTIVSVRLGDNGIWTIARRSDGSAVVTRTDSTSIGASAGIGIDASPLGLKLGVKGQYELLIGSGRTWELPSVAAARRLLDADDDDRPPPTWRFGDLGGELGGRAGASVGGAMLTGVEMSARQAAGARIGKGRTTLYVNARVDGPGLTVWPAGRRRGPSRNVLVELTRERGALREIAFRTTERGGGSGEMVETVARLDLRDPANRAAVEPLLGFRLPWPPAVAADLRAAVRRAVQVGVVERAVYGVEDDSGRFELAGRLGAELGLRADRVAVRRRLVDASAWTGGSGERRRVDCLGG